MYCARTVAENGEKDAFSVISDNEWNPYIILFLKSATYVRKFRSARLNAENSAVDNRNKNGEHERHDRRGER